MSPGSLEPYSIVALRKPNQDGWDIRELGCCDTDVVATLQTAGLELTDLRLLAHGHRPSLNGAGEGHRVTDAALRSGYHWDRDGKTWRAVGEPIALAGQPGPIASVRTALKCIIYGYVGFDLVVAETGVPFLFNDVSDDLSSLIRFTEALRDGGYPHLTSVGTGQLATCITSPTSDLCKVRVVAGPMQVWEIEPKIDVTTEREQLLAAFRDLLCSIADDQRLGSMWVAYGASEDEEYDRVSDAADAAWRALIEAEQVTENVEAEDDFVSHYLARRLTLPSWTQDQLLELQQRLRTA